MQIQERLMVPGLGVVILLSAFILGVPLFYKLLLGLLGLAAAGTYFAPHQVQVETRTAIAALGLIILLIVSSTAFWLTLLSFGAIAALQFQHRHALQRNPATIAWLSTVLKSAQARRSGRADGGGDAGEEAGAVAAAGDGEGAQAPALLGGSDLPAFVRRNPAGIGSSVLGALVLLSLFTPWVIFLVSYDQEVWGDVQEESQSYTLLAAADTLESAVPNVFFGILLVLALLSIASIVLPRFVVAIVSVAGFLVTSFSWFYFLGEQLFAKHFFADADFVPPGVGAITFPFLGVWLASVCFIVIFLLQLIPRLNRRRPQQSPPP